MRVVLVQHGEALASDIDPRRPLSGEGESAVRRVAQVLDAAGVAPGVILHSGKLRARQTAEIFAEILGLTAACRQIPGINPTDPVADFIAEMAAWRTDTMVIGHLPFLARLVSALLAGDSGLSIVSYRPGSTVCLEQDGEQGWMLAWMLRPELAAACP